MDYTVKLAYQSNYWYNDGLAKARKGYVRCDYITEEKSSV